MKRGVASVRRERQEKGEKGAILRIRGVGRLLLPSRLFKMIANRRGVLNVY